MQEKKRREERRGYWKGRERKKKRVIGIAIGEGEDVPLTGSESEERCYNNIT